MATITSVFLQVRLDSSRLPRKALLKLSGITVVEHAMRALNMVKADHHMILTTTDSESELRPLAEQCGWNVFTGPENDVLARYILAARETGTTRLVRATGDNPLVSVVMANEAIRLFEESAGDLAGFSELPLGAGVEIIKTASLEEAYREAKDPCEREHVSPFLYRHPERYRILTPPAPHQYRAPEIRITLDTPEDYARLERLYENLYKGFPLELDVVIPYLALRIPDAS